MTINMIQVSSNSIAQIGYKRRTMQVTFNAGKTYEFKKVPRALYDSFMKSASKGKFFIDEVKEKFSYQLV